MNEVGKSRLTRGALVAFWGMSLAFGAVHVSAAQTINQRLSASRRSFGGTEGFVDPSGRAFTFCRVQYRQVRRERGGARLAHRLSGCGPEPHAPTLPTHEDADQDDPPGTPRPPHRATHR